MGFLVFGILDGINNLFDNGICQLDMMSLFIPAVAMLEEPTYLMTQFSFRCNQSQLASQPGIYHHTAPFTDTLGVYFIMDMGKRASG